MAAASQKEASLTGRVLVVDDHARARESMADVLRHAGHKVQCCTCAAEALQLLKTAHFDCIITDLQMPGMSGIEFIIQLRQRQCPTQVVMVTAHARWPRPSKRCGMGPSITSKSRSMPMPWNGWWPRRCGMASWSKHRAWSTEQGARA